MVLGRFRLFLDRFSSFYIVLGRFNSFLTLVSIRDQDVFAEVPFSKISCFNYKGERTIFLNCSGGGAGCCFGMKKLDELLHIFF